eukprot:gnl/Trimastix_PCT/1546.p1 GENE.gnl/Trimastix_PCT/1546~~gnl/Trimastix_PCT/1546.p1  ORF type:complete len:871 (+),score=438.45 gnl/Trimastix_PCT/1546:34-2646(+)
MEDRGEKPDIEPGLDNEAFDALERDFHDFLRQLVGDESLQSFRVEYEKLHRALKKSHESEKRLIRRCKELNAEIVSNAAKVRTALKLSHEDANTISSLKKEIDKAFKMVNASREKERLAKETIEQLKAEITNLGKLVQQGAGISVGQESTLNELLREKEELLRMREELQSHNEQLKTRISELHERIQYSESEKAQQEQEIRDLNSTIQARKSECEREALRRVRAEKQLQEKESEITRLQADIAADQQRFAQQKQKEMDKEADYQRRLRLQDEYQRQMVDLQNQYDRSKGVIDRLQAENARLEQQRNHDQIIIRNLDEEGKRVRDEKAKIIAERDRIDRQMHQHIEESRKYMNLHKTKVEEIRALEREKDREHRRLNEFVQKLSLEKNRSKAQEERVQEQRTLVQQAESNTKVAHSQIETLLMEIEKYKREAEKKRALITRLEKERDSYSKQRDHAHARFEEAMQELKMRGIKAQELENRIKFEREKNQQQQNLYETVRTERNVYSRDLMNATDQISELRRKFKIMEHQVEQLKEEIKAKDKALVEENFTLRRSKSKVEALGKQNEECHREIQSAEATIKSHKDEIHKLGHIISTSEAQVKRQREEYKAVMNQRDILGSQLIRRNDELALLYEKIKIQQSTLNKGEVQYRARLDDIRVLRQKMGDLKTNNSVLRSKVDCIQALKTDVVRLERDLLEERRKTRALTEELENPMNVHRWRRLSGSDPETYDMLVKIQTLQRRLIRKQEEVVEMQLKLEDKERLYNKLKDILRRQPGPEIAERLSDALHRERKKTDQMRAMAAELNLKELQVNEFKCEIQILTRETQDLKRKYYDSKRRIREIREKERGETRIAPNPIPQGPRFTGGGFSLDRT